ncbi:hypothetical protein FS749_001117 [Ceratobasidium sp. UAMH 11750]|nr:hypothetical protein FS749_001117 [Ceratobasidium sp. UAMH 11750]
MSRRRPLLKVAVGKGKRTEHLVGVENDGAGNVLLLELGDRGSLDLLDVGRLGTGATNDDMALAHLGQNLGRSLEIQSPFPVGGTDDDTHRLALARKRNHLNNLGTVPRLLVRRPLEVLGKAE